MKNAKKIAACSMAATMIVSSALASAGCSKKPKGSNETISEDTPWYTVNQVTVGSNYKNDDSVDYTYLNFCGREGDNLVYEVYGYYKEPEDIDYMNYNWMDYRLANIDIYSIDGDLVKSINVSDVVDESGIYDNLLDDEEETGDGAEDEGSDHAPATAVGAAGEGSSDAADDAEPANASDSDAAADEETDVDADSEEVSDSEIEDGMDTADVEAYDSETDFSTYWNLESVKVKDGEIVATVSGGAFSTYADYDYGTDTTAEFTFDAATGELVSTEIVESFNDGDMNGSSEGSFSYDGYTVEKVWLSDDASENYSYLLNVTKPDGSKSSIDLRDALPGIIIYDLPNILYLGDGKILFEANDINWESTYYTVDLNSGSAEEYGGDTSWFSNEIYNTSYVDGYGNVTIDQKGIKLLDFDNKEKTQVFSFDNCNINRYDATSGLSIVSITDDEIILTGTVFRGNGYASTMDSFETQLYVLRRADSNPNVGKKILVAATLGYFDYTLCEAVCEYNDTNPDYFIRLDSKYSVYDKFTDGAIDYESEDAETQELQAEADLSNQLTIDLLAGDGPDIILGGSSFYQLNNEDYLLDLSEDVSTDGLFANVIDASKTDGKLYQVPLTIGINGIVVHKSDVDADQHGFTFEQYADFVSGPCNGTDPLQQGQLDFLMTALTTINADCMEGDKVNYSNDAFTALAEYVNENVNDIITDEEGMSYYSGMGYEDDAAAHYEMMLSFSSLINMYSSDVSDLTVLGVPSVDGRGPVIGVQGSIAVSAQTQEKDACVAFVNTLLSEDIQADFGRYDYCNPVRVSAFETTAQEAIDLHNEYVADQARYLSAAEMQAYGIFEIDSSCIDIYEDMLESCTQIAAVDPAVIAIIREEMPAYFSGQKSLDDVIEIMEERVQTFINERG